MTSTTIKRFVTIGVVFIITSIILGAFGAHALKSILSEKSLLSFEVGVRYQMFSGLGILILLLLKIQFQLVKVLDLRFIIIGVYLFSGSIYLLAFDDYLKFGLKSVLWPLTPLGGLLLILGWCVFLFQLIRRKTITE